MKSKRLLSLLLLTAMLASAVSCGDSGGTTETTASDETGTTAETTAKPEYEFPELDCGGEEFTILSLRKCWDMYTHLDFDTQSGEPLDDAVYNRNRTIEEKFKVKLTALQEGIDNLGNLTRTAAMAGDSTYDAAYIKGEHIGGVLADGCLLDLTTISTLNLDKPWWNQNVREASAIGKNGAVYFAISDLSLTGFDLTWCLMFNETMCENLKLDKPYDLVRDGKWTLDALHTYTKAGANLNGDESFSFDVNGKSVYGFTSYYNVSGMMMNGANCHLTETKDGVPTLSVENERFYEFCDKFAGICKTEGEYIDANGDDMHYEKIFKAGRAFFVGAEIKATSVFRDFEDTFGLLPPPKLDEAQENYETWVNFLVPVLTVPVTTKDPERTGIILDALSYLSTKDVLPIYYNVTVSQKGLRNDDSIEMLDIIRDARYFEPSLAYGWTNSLFDSLRNSLVRGDGNVASMIASNKERAQEKINATLALLD